MKFQLSFFKNALYCTFVVAFTSLVLLYNIQAYPIALWDESRLAINAIEMAQNNNFLVTHYQGEPDFWNTKPPFLIILQALCIKIFGITELAIRVPSLLATLFTSILLFFWTKKTLNDAFFGALSVVLFMFSHAFINHHGARFGDYDALLVCLTFFASYFYYNYLTTSKNKYLLLFFAMLTLAVLTKGIAGMLFAPAWLLATVISKKVVYTVKNHMFYFGFLVFIIMMCSYYYAHELATPGYLQAVYDNELGGRFLEVNEGHDQPFYFYLIYLFTTKHHYLDYILLFFILLGFGFKIKPKVSDQNLQNYLITLIVLFLFVISSSQTKLGWYIYPVYPLVVILTNLFLHGFWNKMTSVREKISFIVLLFGICLSCFIYTFISLSKQHVKLDNYNLISFLKEQQFNQELNNCTIFSANSMPHNVLFYVYQYANKGVKIHLNANNKSALLENTCVILEKNALPELSTLFNFVTIVDTDNMYRILLKDEK
jgi:4-amino-4-deoxy-L-arabinose transferase-like glycosyltransferase